MSLKHGLGGLAKGLVASSKALPTKGGAGAPIKLSPRPDKPLPLWYETWWDNGIYPGQPIVDHMYGAMPANLTEYWYGKAWILFGAFMGLPIWYHANYSDEFRHPMVPPQYPPEVRQVLLRSRNNSLKYDYSQPDYEEQKAKRQNFFTFF
uniref:NADH dehydrogenase [ubiquinone] 1 beta subcomplex subunit 8, mitochondrial n=1 Tax=Dunaliella tertiolecta TaxID=3047 RepID=A0A7S3QU91_DUNTE